MLLMECVMPRYVTLIAMLLMLWVFPLSILSSIHCFRKNISDELVAEKAAVVIPDELVILAKGTEVLKEEGPRVAPLTDFPDPGVLTDCKTLHASHTEKAKNVRF